MALRSAALAAVFLVITAHGLAAEPTFTESLTPEQRQRLGLAGLSASQMAELDAAVAAYERGETSVAVKQAVQQAERKSEEKVEQVRRRADEKVQQAERRAAAAAETAVADYRMKQEPGVIARTLDSFKRTQAGDPRDKFTGRVVGEFRGWRGGTYFPLEGGQVWRQVGSDVNELPPVQNADVEFYKSSSGYWRLRYNGAWITVKRVQ